MSGNDERPGKKTSEWFDVDTIVMMGYEPVRPVLPYMALCPICRRIVLEEDKWHEHGVCVYCYNGTSPRQPLRRERPTFDLIIEDEDYDDWEEDEDEW